MSDKPSWTVCGLCARPIDGPDRQGSLALSVDQGHTVYLCSWRCLRWYAAGHCGGEWPGSRVPAVPE